MLAGTDYLQRSQGCRHQVGGASLPAEHHPLHSVERDKTAISPPVSWQDYHHFHLDGTQVEATALRVRNFLRRDSADCEIETNSRPKSWSLPHLTSASTCMAVTWSGILKLTAK